MTQRYRKFKRSWGIWYAFDTVTGNSVSLKTRVKAEAEQKVNAMNETERQPSINLGLAKVYLNATDPKLATRTWQEVMETWAAKDIPARLLAGQVAKLLNCSTDDVAILVSAGKLRALGRSRTNAVKFFSAVELIALLADREWLDEAMKTIGQFWRQKNARRNGLTSEFQADDNTP